MLPEKYHTGQIESGKQSTFGSRFDNNSPIFRGIFLEERIEVRYYRVGQKRKSTANRFFLSNDKNTGKPEYGLNVTGRSDVSFCFFERCSQENYMRFPAAKKESAIAFSVRQQTLYEESRRPLSRQEAVKLWKRKESSRTESLLSMGIVLLMIVAFWIGTGFLQNSSVRHEQSRPVSVSHRYVGKSHVVGRN